MCGIAGIVTKTPRAFDYSGFCTLGIVNDSRGGDSCGIFIDGKYEYGVDKNKLFSSYFVNSDLLDSIQRSSVAFVHCRKASMGGVSEATAQPVIITEKDSVKFVVIHNGTIYNYKELAEKYIPDVDITGMTDSQVMARIFYYSGYDVLNEYNGGSAFAIADYRGASPKILLFKGASKKNRWSSDIEVERPLFYCIDKNKRELVFSSIWPCIAAIRRNIDVYCVMENTLVEFNGKALAPVKYYSRANCVQSKDSLYESSKVSSLWDDNIIVSNYLKADLEKNVYSYNEKKVHGRLYVNKWGRVESKPTKASKAEEMYFYDGVALKSIQCYRFLSCLKRELKLSDEDFHKKFENVIRFLSIDSVYQEDGTWYKAISATERELFTGKIRPIGCISVVQISNGKKTLIYYDYDRRSAESLQLPKVEMNFKTIREECKSLMK